MSTKQGSGPTVALRKAGKSGDMRGGIAFRVVDRSNYIRVCPSTAGILTLYVIENGNAVKSVSTESALADGDVLAVSGNGTTIMIQINDSTVLGYKTADYHTATKHGLYSHSSNSTEFDHVGFKL